MPAFPVDIIPVVILSIAPGIFWLWYFYKRNTLEPEPKALVAQVFFFGMICLAPAALIEQPFRPYPFVQTVIVAPIVEELIKFLLVYLWIARRTDFNEPMDGIVYASAAALGFASAENALYIASAYLFPQIALDIHDPAYGLQWVEDLPGARLSHGAGPRRVVGDVGIRHRLGAFRRSGADPPAHREGRAHLHRPARVFQFSGERLSHRRGGDAVLGAADVENAGRPDQESHRTIAVSEECR